MEINNNVARFQIKHFLLFTGIFVFILIAFILLIIDQSHEYLKQDERALQKYFQDFNDKIGCQFLHIENYLRQIRISAEADLFESRQCGVRFPFSYKFIDKGADKDYYHMDNISAPFQKHIHVNLTGSGDFHNRGEDFDRFTQMALNLSDDLYALKQASPNVIYVYCMTKNKQFVHHPWVPSKKYHFEDSAYSYDVWKLSLPENNPEKKLFWTSVYIDVSDGGGLMTSGCTPIYDQDKFIGMVGVDITVDFLNEVAAEFEPQRKGYMVVFDTKENILAHPTVISYNDKKVKNLKDGLPEYLASHLDKVLKAPDNVIEQQGRWKYIRSPLEYSPYSTLYYYPSQSLMDTVISRMGYGNIGFIVCMLILVFSSLFMTHRKLVRPAEKFVNFILAKSKNKDIHPSSKLPKIWRPWFFTIDNVFNENNRLNENIKHNNIMLEKKNIELEQEIEAKNRAEKAKEALERQLIEEEKLKTIGLLSGGIAHDFNNQLAVIMGYASVMRSQKNLSEDKKMQCLDQILSSANNSSSLIKQLLAFSRKGKYQDIPVNIHDVIDEVISILTHTIDKRISIKADLTATKYTVKGDPAQIQNVIMNIAINAKNAMPNGGMITFKTTNEVLTEAECEKLKSDLSPGEVIKISVSDTGTGIAPKDKEHIFEPFFTTKNSGHGVGLGLAAALGTIKNHHGNISVESALGMGTDFRILLPVLKENVKSSESKNVGVAKISASKVKLLLIDDEKAFCRMLTDFMGALGYTIVTYSNPLKAVEYYQNSWQEINLVIMDMIMPKISGYDMINRFEKINSQVKIVISSAYSDENDLQKLLNDKNCIVGFHKKPFDLIKFANSISSLLGEED
jgi:signal transduction histidine kinase